MKTRFHKHCFIIGISLITLSGLLFWQLGCAGWTPAERTKAGTILALKAVDIYQTDRLTTGSDHKEGNPLMVAIAGEEIEWYEATLITAIVYVPGYFLLDSMDHKWRNITLNTVIGISSAVVIWNMQF